MRFSLSIDKLVFLSIFSCFLLTWHSPIGALDGATRVVPSFKVPPKCDVTTALLILLKVTGRGKQDLVEQVLDIDTYEWCSCDADDCEHLRMTKGLLYKITSTLGKVSGKEGVDRKRMLLSGADSKDTKRCLTRRLHEDYVSMPTKKQKRKRASTAASSTEVQIKYGICPNLSVKYLRWMDGWLHLSTP